MIDGIDEDDFFDDDDNIDGVYGDFDMMKGKKVRHVSGIEGVCTSTSNGYYWVSYGGGQQAFICGNEIHTQGVPTPAELEAYLGHSNGLPDTANKEAST